MVYEARELSLRLHELTLVGQEEGQLEFAGSDSAWDEVHKCRDCKRVHCICDAERRDYEERLENLPF